MKISLKYPAINSKLKAMYSKKLNTQDFLELSRQPDFEKSIAFLKSRKSEFKVLSETADRIEIETQLDKILINDILKIGKMLDSTSKKYLKVFLSKYEIRCIKSVLRKLYSQSILNEDLNNVEIWTESIFKEIKGINNVHDFQEFLYLIKKTPYYKIFLPYQDSDVKKINIFEIENKLDILYFNSLMNVSKNKKNYILTDYIGMQMDLENIVWILRTKKYYNFSKEKIYDTIVKKFYKLSKDEIERIIDSDEYNEVKKILSKTPYGNLVGNDESEFEQNIERYLYKKSKKIFRNNMFNLNFIYVYIDMIDYENNDITNIIEGIRYNLSRQEIMQRLVIDII